MFPSINIGCVSNSAVKMFIVVRWHLWLHKILECGCRTPALLSTNYDVIVMSFHNWWPDACASCSSKEIADAVSQKAGCNIWRCWDSTVGSLQNIRICSTQTCAGKTEVECQLLGIRNEQHHWVFIAYCCRWVQNERRIIGSHYEQKRRIKTLGYMTTLGFSDPSSPQRCPRCSAKTAPDLKDCVARMCDDNVASFDACWDFSLFIVHQCFDQAHVFPIKHVDWCKYTGQRIYDAM